jgi:hypothetical protein
MDAGRTVMKTADVVTSCKVDPHAAVVENSRDEHIVQRTESDTAASTMFAVPCWWSWKTAMLTQSE